METDDLHSVPDHLATPRESKEQKHPRGLATLFFTEMWERFSYYGMRALLVLFMVDAVRGGMGMDDKTATAIYGIYTAAVYLMSLPGGWLADRIFGAQRAVWYGGIIIALGHFTLAIPTVSTFYLGLIFVVVGSGILKPNMSALVADLYPEGGARRDAGFTIFYMGVNLGAAIGPIICGFLATKCGWHWGFGAAGVGMVLGLLQFYRTKSRLGLAGQTRAHDVPLRSRERAAVVGILAATAVGAVLLFGNFIRPNPVKVAQGMTFLISACAIAFFAAVFLLGNLSKIEKERVAMILVLFLASALFWAGFEQAGSSFNLFAERYTQRNLFDFEIPAAAFQALGPVFIIALAPVFAGLWVWLARRNLEPSIPVKFGLGLLLLAAGFLVMAGAAKVVAAGQQAWPTWLMTTYLVHTFGELCLSPVGLSSVTKLSPRHLTGQMMGIWFLGSSLGNVIAGLMAGNFDPAAIQGWSAVYLQIAILPTIAGGLLILFSKPLKRLVVGVK
jgi:POT family proton-dependent oligopeptide transporter